MSSIHTFVTENKRSDWHDIQWQLRDFTISCVARDLLFSGEILAFVAETRANPAYRDIPLGKGMYRHMPEKRIDLSYHFVEVKFELWKLGKYNHGYLLRVAADQSLWISIELHERELDDFLDGLREIAGT